MTRSKIDEDLPIGELVEDTAPSAPPGRKVYEGRFVGLHPVDPEKDAAELYRHFHGSPQNDRVWTYMAYGPFGDRTTMQQWLRGCEASADPLFLTVGSKELNRRVGVVSFLNIVSAMRSLEVGNIWYAPIVQHTKVNTETIYLMLCEAFDLLNYRRVEWKCDAFNARSRKAALRLGFSFEGIFRQHYIIKGRNRDTAWFAMLDRDWPAVKSNMERWLYSGAEGLSLTELNRTLLRTAG